jgi:hypothetical protein
MAQKQDTQNVEHKILSSERATIHLEIYYRVVQRFR